MPSSPDCLTLHSFSLTQVHWIQEKSSFSLPATQRTTRTAGKNLKSRSSLWCQTAPGVSLHLWTSSKPRLEVWPSLHLWWELLIGNLVLLSLLPINSSCWVSSFWPSVCLFPYDCALSCCRREVRWAGQSCNHPWQQWQALPGMKRIRFTHSLCLCFACTSCHLSVSLPLEDSKDFTDFVLSDSFTCELVCKHSVLNAE